MPAKTYTYFNSYTIQLNDLSSSETFCFSSAICGFIISGWLVTLRISLGDLGPDHLLQLSIYKQPYRNN